MSTESQRFGCFTPPCNLFSQEEASMSSFESVIAYFPLPQSPKLSLDMSSDGCTMLELHDARAFLSSLYPVSENGLTVAPREIYQKPEASSQSIGSREERILHHVSDSTEIRCLYTDEYSPISTAGPHRADCLEDLHLQGPVEFRTIPPPGFECRDDDCYGKNGRKKTYARAEHRNRHERTVHRKTASPLYKCWVKDCRSKSFTRADNLKAHLMDRHGRKSRAGRYQYIATLDRSSSYYDPEWTGNVTSDGLPK